MPDASVDRALTDRGQSVNSRGTAFSRVRRGVYDAPTMHKSSTSSIALILALAAAVLPAGAQTGAAANGISLTTTRVVGSDAVRITGSAPASRPLEASLWVTYS